MDIHCIAFYVSKSHFGYHRHLNTYPLFFPCTTMFRSASTHIKYGLLFYLNTPVKIVHAIEEFFCFYYLFVVRVNTYFKIAVDRKIVQYVLKIMKYFIFLVSNNNSLKITYMNFRSY